MGINSLRESQLDETAKMGELLALPFGWRHSMVTTGHLNQSLGVPDPQDAVA